MQVFSFVEKGSLTRKGLSRKKRCRWHVFRRRMVQTGTAGEACGGQTMAKQSFGENPFGRAIKFNLKKYLQRKMQVFSFVEKGIRTGRV